MEEKGFLENIPENIRQCYVVWLEFMENQIEFWKVEGNWHTKPHCSRVLLLALLLGNKLCLHDSEMAALATAGGSFP